jgi:hypothetical protein
MTSSSKLMSGIILLTVPTIQYSGYFLLQLLSGMHSGLALTDFQRSMFRAGHAHAGVLVMFALLLQLMIDHAALSETMKWVARIGFPLAAILISAGFFGAASGKGITAPTSLISILYFGVAVLAVALIISGVGLVKAAKQQ